MHSKTTYIAAVCLLLAIPWHVQAKDNKGFEPSGQFDYDVSEKDLKSGDDYENIAPDPHSNRQSKEKKTQSDMKTCLEEAPKILDGDRTISTIRTFESCRHSLSRSFPLTHFYYGLMRMSGIGCDPDLKDALNSLTIAAESDIAGAQAELADYYASGRGIKKNINLEMAKKWLARLAAQRDPRAKIAARTLCGMAIGSNDGPSSAQWCSEAGLKHRDPEGLRLLGDARMLGIGFDRDPKIAAELYRESANMGHVPAMTELGHELSTGANIPADEKLAMEWLMKASDAGDATAAWLASGLAEYGFADQAPDPELAAKLIEKAAKSGHAEAQNSLGMRLLGKEIPETDKALVWLHKAAAQQHAGAMAAIGNLYLKQNPAEAERWFRKAATLGRADAMRNLCDLYERGAKGVKKDPEAALAYAKLWAETEPEAGSCRLADYLSAGIGCSPDSEAAQKIRDICQNSEE